MSRLVVEKNPWAAIGVIPIGKQVAKSIIIIEKRTGVCLIWLDSSCYTISYVAPIDILFFKGKAFQNILRCIILFVCIGYGYIESATSVFSEQIRIYTLFGFTIAF